MRAVTLELDRLDSRGDDVTLIPLYHALDTLSARQPGPTVRQAFADALARAEKLPQLTKPRDDRAQVVRLISRLKAALV